MWDALSNWLNSAPIVAPAALVLVLMAIAAAVGKYLRGRHRRRDEVAGIEPSEGAEGYIVSAVLGLLALLMGFTFSMAVDRFDARRSLVVEEANALGTTYLRTQLLQEPHRERISVLLTDYTKNRIQLARAGRDELGPRLATNDRLLLELWTATVAAFPTIQGLDFSSAYLDSVNQVIDLDESRKAARVVRVPPEVFIIMFVYMIVTAGVMGYVLVGPRSQAAGLFMMLLMTLALMLVIDIDRPARGGITESQAPMERLRDGIMAQPRQTFDRFRLEDARTAPA